MNKSKCLNYHDLASCIYPKVGLVFLITEVKRLLTM